MNYFNLVKDFILTNCLSFYLDQTEAYNCPVCKAQHEKSFYVTRIDTGWIYLCHRVKCGTKGIYYSKQNIMKKTPAKEFVPKYPEYYARSLPKPLKEYIQQKYKLSEEAIIRHAIGYIEKQNRLWLPVFNKSGTLSGCLLKDMNPSLNIKPQTRKILNYFWDDIPKLSYALLSEELLRDDVVILVEDMISAIRISDWVPSIAILGTNLNLEGAVDIASKYQHIYLALDPDTWKLTMPKAFELRQKWAGYFKTFCVLSLTADPKDLEEDDFTKQIIEPLTS